MEGLTPELVCRKYSNKRYQIPIYQRLFEWDQEKIEQLLNDLYISYKKDETEPYYVGMLTSTIDGEDLAEGNNLVDGQQRFTVMTLIGLVMRTYCKEWEDFIKISSEQTRLFFAVRPDDQAYLEYKILNKGERAEIIVNKKMERGEEYIKAWLDSKDEETQKKFSQFVFQKLTFFISELPKNYKGRDLNKYFESMNSTGRNLENHEIQKIKSLSKINVDLLKKEVATKIWNVVSQMDKQLIRIKKNKNEAEDVKEVHDRFEKAIEACYLEDISEVLGLLNAYSKDSDETMSDAGDNDSLILNIPMSNKKPEKHLRSGSYHGMLSFSEFLLQVLYIQLGYSNNNDLDDLTINDFFDVQQLLKTFSDYTEKWNDSNWVLYFRNLLKYRLLFDYYVIRIPNEEDGPFKLEFSDSNENNSNEKLRQYQAMLYAGSSSKSFYLWLNPFLSELEKWYRNNQKPSSKELVKYLKENDNNRHKPMPSVDEFSYTKSPLYWFRRLDYYLWEDNLKNHDERFDLINAFRFRRGGRSIEHLHPQDDSKFKQDEQWDKEEKDRFGNLCLISSSFNSTQSNDSLGVKIARVEDQIKKKQLESIKLYVMYKAYLANNSNWSKIIMEEHEKHMYQILTNSFTSDND